MSISNSEYLTALQKTKNVFGDTSVGFIGENPNQTTTAKQLNTIIQLIIQLHTEIGVIKAEIATIKAKVNTQSTSSDYSADLDNITERLAELKIKPPTRGTLKVLKKF